MKLLSWLLLLTTLFSCSYYQEEDSGEVEIARQKIIEIKNSNEEEYIKQEMIGIVIAQCHVHYRSYGNVVYENCARELVGRLK